MALSEQEEFELLRLERERAQSGGQVPPSAAPTKERFIPGDAGAQMNAADLYGAIQSGIEHLGYKAGEKVSDAASKVLTPEGAATLGAGTNMAVQAVPTMLGGEAGKLASPAMVSGAKRLMRSALKPDKFARTSGAADKAVDTLLERGVNVTQGGVDKLNAAIDKLDNELERVISQSKAEVSKIDVLKPIKGALERFRNQATPNSDLADIRQAAKEFFNHPSLRGKESIPIQQAQELKRGTYRALGSQAYGKGLKSDAEREGKKALASGLMTGVERGAPEAGAINAEMGPLVNARNLAQDRVQVAPSRNIAGLGILNPKELVPWMLDRSELAKSLAARGMYQGAERIPQVAGNTVGLGAEMALGLPTPPPQEKTR